MDSPNEYPSFGLTKQKLKIFITKLTWPKWKLLFNSILYKLYYWKIAIANLGNSLVIFHFISLFFIFSIVLSFYQFIVLTFGQLRPNSWTTSLMICAFWGHIFSDGIKSASGVEARTTTTLEFWNTVCWVYPLK